MPPLAVCPVPATLLGLNVPQSFAPQLVAVQSTPALPISLVTAALNLAGDPAVTLVGADVIFTEIVGAILICAVPILVGSVREDAERVNSLSAGAMVGAV